MYEHESNPYLQESVVDKYVCKVQERVMMRESEWGMIDFLLINELIRSWFCDSLTTILAIYIGDDKNNKGKRHKMAKEGQLQVKGICQWVIIEI